MKYVFLLGAIAGVYLIFFHTAPVAPVIQAVTAQEAVPLTAGARGQTQPPEGTAPPHSDFLKRPIDRTHEVLEQVKTRNGDGEF